MTKELQKVPRFLYWSHEEVCIGDIVKTGTGKDGVVVMLIAADSGDAEAYQCPDGGVMIEEDWDGTPSLLLMTPPDGEYWEDLDFVQRSSRKSTQFD